MPELGKDALVANHLRESPMSSFAALASLIATSAFHSVPAAQQPARRQ